MNGDSHAIGDGDGIGLRDLEHINGNRWTPVDLGSGAPLLGSVDHGADVAKLDGNAVANRDSDIGEGHRLDDPTSDADELLRERVLNAPGWHFLILELQCLHDLHGAHVVRVHRARVELHPDLTAVPAHNVDAANAGNRLETWSNYLIGEVRDLAQ